MSVIDLTRVHYNGRALRPLFTGSSGASLEDELCSASTIQSMGSRVWCIGLALN